MYNRFCYTCNGYIQHPRLRKYCRLCLDIRKQERLTQSHTQTESEEEQHTQLTSEPVIIEDRRIINRTVEVNLYMLHEYFKLKYDITETIQDIFNMYLKWSKEIGSGRRD